MSISAISGQDGGNNGNSATSVSRAFSIDVTVGRLIVICGMKYSPSTDAFVAGDCTKSAGTATIGTITLDRQHNLDSGAGTFAAVGIWSAVVTGAGPLTMQIGGALAGSYILIASHEFAGNWDSSRVEAVNSNGSSTDGQTTFSSGNVTTAGAALIVGCAQFNTGSAQTNTPDGAFTEIYTNESGTDDNGVAAYRIVSSGLTEQFDGIMGADNGAWAAAVVAYKEAAGGGGGRIMRPQDGMSGGMRSMTGGMSG